MSFLSHSTVIYVEALWQGAYEDQSDVVQQQAPALRRERNRPAPDEHNCNLALSCILTSNHPHFSILLYLRDRHGNGLEIETGIETEKGAGRERERKRDRGRDRRSSLGCLCASVDLSVPPGPCSLVVQQACSRRPQASFSSPPVHAGRECCWTRRPCANSSTSTRQRAF